MGKKLRYRLHWASGDSPHPSLKWTFYDWHLIKPIFYTESRVIGRKVCNLLNSFNTLTDTEAHMDGIARIALERHRQVTAEDWTKEHDDAHTDGELIQAAVCYLAHTYHGDAPKWPWEPSSWKPSDDPIRNLEKAGALIAAEMDRWSRLRGVDSLDEQLEESAHSLFSALCEGDGVHSESLDISLITSAFRNIIAITAEHHVCWKCLGRSAI